MLAGSGHEENQREPGIPGQWVCGMSLWSQNFGRCKSVPRSKVKWRQPESQKLVTVPSFRDSPMHAVCLAPSMSQCLSLHEELAWL